MCTHFNQRINRWTKSALLGALFIVQGCASRTLEVKDLADGGKGLYWKLERPLQPDEHTNLIVVPRDPGPYPSGWYGLIRQCAYQSHVQWLEQAINSTDQAKLQPYPEISELFAECERRIPRPLRRWERAESDEGLVCWTLRARDTKEGDIGQWLACEPPVPPAVDDPIYGAILACKYARDWEWFDKLTTAIEQHAAGAQSSFPEPLDATTVMRECAVAMDTQALDERDAALAKRDAALASAAQLREELADSRAQIERVRGDLRLCIEDEDAQLANISCTAGADASADARATANATTDAESSSDASEDAHAPVARGTAPDTIELDCRIHFDTDKASIEKKSKPCLDTLVEKLERAPEISSVEIQGHTDEQGTAAHNQELSERRAQKVREYLISEGIEAGRLTAKGYGQSVPRCEETGDSECNRRVEFHVLERAAR